MCWPQKELRNSGRVESITSWQEETKIQIILATTCNKKEQQNDAKNNAELKAEWTKTGWKTYEGAETGLLRPKSWRMMMMMSNQNSHLMRWFIATFAVTIFNLTVCPQSRPVRRLWLFSCFPWSFFKWSTAVMPLSKPRYRLHFRLNVT
jgi:GTP cyclohydrolase FolE2